MLWLFGHSQQRPRGKIRRRSARPRTYTPYEAPETDVLANPEPPSERDARLDCAGCCRLAAPCVGQLHAIRSVLQYGRRRSGGAAGTELDRASGGLQRRPAAAGGGRRDLLRSTGAVAHWAVVDPVAAGGLDQGKGRWHRALADLCARVDCFDAGRDAVAAC